MNDLDSTKRDILVKIAKKYFIENLSQQKIANQLGISRSNISKLLKKCRDLKIVEIRVNDTSSIGVIFQKEIKKEFKINNIIVVPSEKDIEKTKMQVGKAAAGLFQSLLKDRMKIGIAWGSTIYHAVNQFVAIRNLMDMEVIQLVGGIGTVNLITDGFELARMLAEKLNAKCSILQAPLVVQTRELRNMLLHEQGILQILKRAEEIDIALLGIGTNYIESSALYRAGLLTKKESNDLLAKGVVGDLCGKQIDINGEICNTEINERTIGIDLNKLKNIPQVICAAAGEQKAGAILGALRGRFINSLVTDEIAAMRILSLMKQTQK
ncbi:MAG: sugar-binding transcriptional regulator [Spirochaetales bacterium]|nr:sugar-binding transcriptional regulator [Spirochaetales bacterium]